MIKKIKSNLFLIIIYAVMAIVFIDFIRFPECYISTWKYQVINEIENGNQETIEWYQEKHGSVREALAGQNAFVQWAAMVVRMTALLIFGIFRGRYISSEFIYKQF